MTELEVYSGGPSRDVVTMQDVAIRRLAEWAHSAEAAHRIAETLVQTSFCPDSFRGKAGDATAAILAGIEIGLSPMAALRSFDIISGTAAPRALTLRAIVQSYGHSVVVEESTATRCVVKAKRKGDAEWQRVMWTVERAQQLGVTNKPNWRNQPQAMLVARATSEACRLIAADAILGIGYSAEEVEDGAETVSDGPTEAPAPTTGTRKMSRRKPAPEQPEAPEQVVEPEPEPEPGEPESDGITDKQLRKMGVLMREQNMADRDEALEFVASVIGRTIETRNDLTKDEASRVIDALNQLADVTGAAEAVAE